MLTMTALDEYDLLHLCAWHNFSLNGTQGIRQWQAGEFKRSFIAEDPTLIHLLVDVIVLGLAEGS